MKNKQNNKKIFIILILFLLSIELHADINTQDELEKLYSKEKIFNLNSGPELNAHFISLENNILQIKSNTELSAYEKFADSSHQGVVIAKESQDATKNSFWKNYIELITILAGIIVIFVQNYLQHRSNYSLQKENEREKLKLSIYKDISRAADAFYKCKANSYLIMIKSYLDYASKNNTSSEPPTIYRAKLFMEYHEELNMAIHQIISILSKWEIIAPEFKVFRLAICSDAHNLIKTNMSLFRLLLPCLPVDVVGPSREINVMPPLRIPSKAVIDQTNQYLNEYNKLSCNIHDLFILSQNTLLSNLFNNKIESRKPLNPELSPISFEEKSIEEWVQHFENKIAQQIN